MKATRYIKWSLAAIAAIALFTACGGGGGGSTPPAPAPDPTPPPEPTVITHNGTTYDTVTSPFTGKVWLDRNLGAAQVCIAYNDTACYGDYYQWGRNFDGHQDSLSGTTGTPAVDIDNVGNEFITSPVSDDWAPGPDATGALRVAQWSRTDGGSVCPVGFRVPTITELENETINASAAVTNNTDAFNNFLKLPSTGLRGSIAGAMIDQGLFGSIWSSSVNAISSQILGFYNAGASAGADARAFGRSVRCIKN